MRVFITGGTGTLGRSLIEYGTINGWNITVYSRDEVKQSVLKAEFPNVKYLLGDVTDLQWLKICMKNHDVVIHTAAYKQVPSAEVNSRQAVQVNVLGSINVAQAAVENHIGKVIGISTDKACTPVNCYGATKMIMEKIFQEAAFWSLTKFILIRYGNVLGSRGSVVPFFRKQLSEGKPITLTDPYMTRFWLTLEQARNLVVNAMHNLSENGTILVPKCPASTMHTLALAMGCDSYKIVGIRPGEKLHETLVHHAESYHTYKFDSYFLVYPATYKVKNDSFEYTSRDATQLSVEELKELIDAC